MRARALAIAVATAFVPVAVCARGETSYRLPEVRLPDAAAGGAVVRAPSWSRPASFVRMPIAALARPSALTGLPDMLAHGGGIVSFQSGGRVCGFAETDGAQRWCSGYGESPAYAGGVVAYRADDGTIHAVDAATGAPRWRFAFPTSAEGRGLPGPSIPLSHDAWAAGDGFLVTRNDGRAGRGAPTHGELSPSGRLRWSREMFVGVEAPILVPPYALQRSVGSGARMQATQNVVRLGTGVIAEIVDAWSVVEVRYPSLVVGGDPGVEPVEDRFLTRDVWLADIRDGKIGAQYHYEPDYDINHERYFRNELSDVNEAKGIGTEGDSAYIGVGPNVYRYRLAAADGQRPLLVSSNGRYVGGPIRGAIFIARRDGVWLLRPRARRVEQRLIAPSARPLSALAVAGRVAYVAFEDGHLRGFDLVDERVVLDAHGCAAGRIGVGLQRVYAICATPAGLRVTAFPRPNLGQPV